MDDSQTWSSPAFLQRSHSLYLDYDTFLNEDEFPDNDRRKKARFGRGSDQWRFAERTPSPAKESKEATIVDETTFKKQQSKLPDSDLFQDARVADKPIKRKESSLQEQPPADEPSDHHLIEMEETPLSRYFLVAKEHESGARDRECQEASTAYGHMNVSNGAVSVSQVDISATKPSATSQTPKEALQEESLAIRDSSRSTDQVLPLSPTSVISIGSSSVLSSDTENVSVDDEVASLATESQEYAGQGPSHEFGLDGSILSRFLRASDQPRDHDLHTILTSDADKSNEDSSSEEPMIMEDDYAIDSKVAEAHNGEATTPSITVERGQITGSATSDMLMPSSEVIMRIEQPYVAILPGRELLDKTYVTGNAPNGAQSPSGTANEQSDFEIGNLDMVQHDRSTLLSYTATNPELSEDGSLVGPKSQDSRLESGLEILDLESYEGESQQIPQPVHLEPAIPYSSLTNKPELLDKPRNGNVTPTMRHEDMEPAHSIGEMEKVMLAAHPASPNSAEIEDSQPLTDGNVLDKQRSEDRLENLASAQEASSREDLIVDDEGSADSNNEAPIGQDPPHSLMKASEAENLVELPSTVPDSAVATSTEQLLTPSTTQGTNPVSQPSTLLWKSIPDEDTLPTPRLTQRTSMDNVALSSPLSPASTRGPPIEEKNRMEEDTQPPKSITYDSITSSPPRSPITPVKPRSALVEKLKAMRKTPQSGARARLRNSVDATSPWFAPKRSNHVIPDSETEGGISKSEGRVKQMPLRKAPSILETPEKPLATMFVRSSPAEVDDASTASSPYIPSSQPVVGGLRTNLSYFVPLAALSSHFGTQTDTLAVAIGATSITRASSGLRDFMQSFYISDYSVSSSKSVLTTVQIFRPSKTCFPQIRPGDAILLRNFRVQLVQNRLSLLSTEISAWAVFREGTEPQIRGPPVEFGAEERAFARGHWKWWGSLDHDDRERLQAAIPDEKAQKTFGKVKVKKEGISGIGVELPGSQDAKVTTKKEDSWSTQALANGRSTGLDRFDNQVDDKDISITGRRALRPRNARGKTASPEKEDPPPRKMGSAVKRESKDELQHDRKASEGNAVKGGSRLRLHKFRDGRKYRDRRA